jgi:hypothetical protein
MESLLTMAIDAAKLCMRKRILQSLTSYACARAYQASVTFTHVSNPLIYSELVDVNLLGFLFRALACYTHG